LALALVTNATIRPVNPKFQLIEAPPPTADATTTTTPPIDTAEVKALLDGADPATTSVRLTSSNDDDRRKSL